MKKEIEEKYTFYQVNFINFNHNDGDYMLCKNIHEVCETLKQVDHLLDDESEEERYVEVKPFVATMEYFNSMLESYYSF